MVTRLPVKGKLNSKVLIYHRELRHMVRDDATPAIQWYHVCSLYVTSAAWLSIKVVFNP